MKSAKCNITQRFWKRVLDLESTPQELQAICQDAIEIGFADTYKTALELQISDHLALGQGEAATWKQRVLGFLLGKEASP